MNKYITIMKLILIRNGFKRADYIREKHIFHSMGEKCYYHPWNIPRESYLLSLGNNVVVASGVKFITHDVIGLMLKNREGSKDCGRILLGRIIVGDNVFIGADSKIMPDVTIGSNSIIAAGSVVTSDVPPNSVVGGCPAHFIKSIDNFVEKRRKTIVGMPSWREPRDVIEHYFYKDSMKEDIF